jgi:hemolysin activation/secretion protein
MFRNCTDAEFSISIDKATLGVVLAIVLCGFAQATVPPSSGQLLQEVPTQAARPAQSAPTIIIIRPDSSHAAPGEALLVRRIELTGNALLPADKLRAAVAPSEGKMLTLADLQKLADTITEMYRKAGFPYARAYVPAQTIRNDTIRIAVVEARYDSVKLRNNAHVRDVVLSVPLKGLKIGAAVDQKALDRALLLISDIPGVSVKGTLRPGQTTGASELLVDVDPAPLVYGSVAVDDYGNVATSRARVSGNVSFANPLELGDVLSLNALSSGRGLDYGRIGYVVPVYGPATQLSVSASSLSYRVIYGSAVDVDARGTAEEAGTQLKQFLYRSTAVNVWGEIGFDETQLRDHVGADQTRTDRHTDDWRAAVSANASDAAGFTSASLSITLGHLGFDDAASQRADSVGAQTQGDFTKYNFDISRLQNLTAKTSLYVSFEYQAANANLDPSEQFFVGGPNRVRGYDNGVASGTQGNSSTLELRRDLFVGWPGTWQVGVFADAAHIRIAKNAYDPAPNSASLEATGVSLDWAQTGRWSINSSVATPIGGTPAVVGHSGSLRFWLQLQKMF